MGKVQFSDNAGAVLAVGVGIGDSEFKINSLGGGNFPLFEVSTGHWMYINIGEDLFKVGSAFDDGSHFVFTLYDGETFASAYSAGETVELLVCTDLLNDIIPPSTGRNLLINPEFLVNQEGYSPATSTVTSGAYLWDMWKILSQEMGAANPTSDQHGGVVLDRTELWQSNDDLSSLGKGVDIDIVFSVQTGSVRVTTGSNTGIVSAGSPLTLTYNTLADHGIKIGDTVSSYTFSRIKAESGPVATSYQIPQITEEELKCYRYFFNYPVSLTHEVLIAGSGFSGIHGDILLSFYLPVKMRKVPTLTAAALNFYGGGLSCQDPSPIFSNTSMQENVVQSSVLPRSCIAELHTIVMGLAGTTGWMSFDARY